MKKKILKKTYKKTSIHGLSSTIINIENSEVLDIFGVNNENINFIEKNLPLKLYQKGNQLSIHGNKKNTDILKNAIIQTINEKKMKKKLIVDNLMQEFKNVYIERYKEYKYN